MSEGTAAYEHWEPHDHQATLRNQITRTRADLGDTITELAARTDVKARAREAVAQARSRTRDMVRSTAQSATQRTRDAARSGAASARRAATWIARSPASVAVGGAAGALAGLGLYALLRRRIPSGPRAALRTGLRLRSAKRKAMAHGRQVHGGQVHGRQVHGRQVHGRQVHGRQVHGRQVHGRQMHGRQR